MELSIVIPALNEEDGIGATLDAVHEAMRQANVTADVVVVNDGSTDRTAEIAAAKGARVLSFKRNRGYGAALKAGFENAKYSTLCCLDADGTYPPAEIPKLLAHLHESDADMIVGSRLLGSSGGMPLIRKIGNIGLARIASFLLRTRIYDLTSGMRVFRRETYEHLLPLSDDLDFTLNMTMRAVPAGLKLEEVPIRYDERLGASKLSVSKHGYSFLKTILIVVRDYRPMKIFVPMSLFFVVLAALNLAQLIARRYFGEGVTPSITNGLILSAGLGLFGLQVFFFGVLADMIASSKNTR
ncbi:MAG: glycosyltransferase family 2 protein [Planctomycetes bacterium]|nr:glycosyltransferase family 2 protein [Planctomycetota bacterium]MBM4080115.1 glycosyltransferase family 2 protein [Planctomycetota bacterium]